ncbi:hypothetical protein Tco_1324448 [Tanacetum coccineum]
MAAIQAVKYAPQCGDRTVESVQFQSNNFVGNFSYPQSIPAYKDICKVLWCTAVVEDPNPTEDNSKVRPLKEFIIQFIVMNGKKPLTLDYKTSCEFTGLDYNKGNYVAHPSP